jgi:hypothetical protein
MRSGSRCRFRAGSARLGVSLGTSSNSDLGDSWSSTTESNLAARRSPGRQTLASRVEERSREMRLYSPENK